MVVMFYLKVYSNFGFIPSSFNINEASNPFLHQVIEDITSKSPNLSVGEKNLILALFHRCVDQVSYIFSTVFSH